MSWSSGWILLYALLVALSTTAAMWLARRLAWAQLRWLGLACWGMLALVSWDALTTLYGMRRLPEPGIWLAWLILLAGSEHVLLRWSGSERPPGRTLLQAVHALRTGGPWLALWPAGSILVERWLSGSYGAPDRPETAAWAISAAWSNYLPTWAMMLVLGLLLRRSLADRWPVRPLAAWYRVIVVPCGALLVLALAAVWNLVQDGAMAPLPYLPLLNPLDLTTGFALVLGLSAAKGPASAEEGLRTRLRVAGAFMAYAWFNLILLRSAAHYLGIAYRLEDLAASQFVQAMLSLVWSASALVLMRYAAQRTMRRTWSSGAVLLGIVVAKLFMVDLANGGSMARVVSFVGVGLLMLLVGYFAPYPKAREGTTSPSPGT